MQIVAKISFIDIKYGKLRSELLASITNVRDPPPPFCSFYANVFPIFNQFIATSWSGSFKNFFSLRVHMMNKELASICLKIKAGESYHTIISYFFQTGNGAS